MTQLSPMMEARAFRIWQYANPRDWHCSYEDIGAATGLTRNEIQRALHDKGWFNRIGRGRSPHGGAISGARNVTHFHMRKGHKFDPNYLDTVDLMRAGVFAGADE